MSERRDKLSAAAIMATSTFRRALAGATLSIATTLAAQPATPVAVNGEPVSLSYSYRQFDGSEIELIVLVAKSAEFVSDTFGAWTPHGEGKTSSGFVLRHRGFPGVFVTVSSFSGPGPGKSQESWASYRQAVAQHLGPETTTQDFGVSGAAGGTPSFADWPTREVFFVTRSVSSHPARAERH